MLKNNYMIVLYGEILPGENLETVKEKLAKLFNLSEEQVNSLFSGDRQVVKKNIFNDDAMKYKYVIEKAGAVCHVEVEESDTSNLSVKADSNENIKLKICPKCGYQAQNDNDPLITALEGLGECPSCGIVVSKYESENAPEEQNDENDENFTGFADGHIID
jgi:rubrerythrin